MPRLPFRTALRHPTSLVFFFGVVAGLVMGYARAAPQLTTLELVVIGLLSLVYLFTGTVLFIAALTTGTPAQKMLYLAFQIPLGLLIMYLERGNGWLIMLPLASHSVALFSPREAVLPCVLITLGIAWNTSQFLPNWLPFVQSAMVFGAAVVFTAVFTDISIRDIRRREEIERLAMKLEQANRELQAYAVQAEELATLQERNRLAREIHDGLGHYLTAINLQTEVVGALLAQNPGEAQEALDRLQVMAREALADVRRSVASLRNEPIIGGDLLVALTPLIEESRAAGLRTELVANGEIRRLPAAQELAIYRAVQEGLTNVRKHAQARQAVVWLDYRPGDVGLRVQDDGVGSDLAVEGPELAGRSFGLFGLRERAGLLGGRLAVHTAPGQGFCLEMTLPIIQTPEDDA